MQIINKIKCSSCGGKGYVHHGPATDQCQICSGKGNVHHGSATDQTRLVEIQWQDSQGVGDHWFKEKDIDFDSIDSIDSVICTSVGWLLKDGEHIKVIASHCALVDDPQYCGDMTIPTCSIIKITDLKYGTDK